MFAVVRLDFLSLEFTRISQPLYGSSTDVFHAGDPTVADLATLLEEILQGLLVVESMKPEPKVIPAAEAVIKGRPQSLPLLFRGKAVLEDMRILAGLLEEGVLAPPCYVPTHFTDLKGMTAWMSLSRFLNTLSFDKLEADCAGII